MKKILVAIPIVLLAITFGAGCASNPSLSAGQRLLRRHIEIESEGRLKLSSFERTRDESVGRSSCWAFAGDIEVVEDCVWLFDRPTETVHIDFRTSGANEQAVGEAVKRGQHYSLVAAVYFNKEDKTWKVSHIGIRRFPRIIR
jgi:hypothetical protein